MTLTIATADTVGAEGAFDTGRRQIEEFESCLSRFRPASELTYLNSRNGAWTMVSPLLGSVLQVALEAARRSGGLCTPTLLAALEAAGYDRDFAHLQDSSPTPRQPDDQTGVGSAGHGRRTDRQVTVRQPRASRAPRLRSDAWRRIQSSYQTDGTRWVRLPRGARLDLAGVTKGWTADRIADVLVQVGPCLVDAGGDLAARGQPPGLAGWPVAVADPISRDADLALVLLRDVSIATSGVDFRRWYRQGRPQHHLIDPRTGEPSRTDVLTASVIAPTAAEADVHAKTTLLMGVRRGLAYLAFNNLAGLVVRRDGRWFTTSRWSDYAISE